MSRRLLPVLLLLAGCGYFNAMYNAERSFEEAERAAARGEHTRAADSYEEAIRHAAVSYRGHPDGRWSDDALYLVVRARFGRGEYVEAAVAAERLAAIAANDETRLGARAYRGAALVRLDSAALALPPLDTVVTATRADRPLGTFSRLWRARARFALGESDAAWADLAEAQQASGTLAAEAMLEGGKRALAAEDSARLRAATAALLGQPDAALRRDTLIQLVRAGAVRWNPAFAASLLAAPSEWLPGSADSVALVRATLLGQAGETDAALAMLTDVYERSSGATGNAARRTAANLMLARASVDELEAVRAVLLPAVVDPVARELVRDLQIVGVLAARGRAGQPLALFAAAEHARDRLHARPLARALFLEYAELASGSEWAPKAVLAALALVDDAAQRAALLERLQRSSSSVYVAGFRGDADLPALYAAEERLARVVGALREGAAQEAGRRDLAIDRAVAIVDSLRDAAVTDSLTIACGSYVDSLAIIGIRADSVRAACVRSDTLRIHTVLAIDTMELVDTTVVRADSAADPFGEKRVEPDTVALR